MAEFPECTLRIIEPNMSGHSGHYAELVRAIAAGSQGVFAKLEVCADERAGNLVQGDPLIRLRAPAGGETEYRWLGHALESGEPFLVLTAKAAHAAMLSWLARGQPERLRNARLFFHWQERGAVNRALMAAAFSVRANTVAIAPTEATASYLRRCGWARVRHVPYPMIAPELPAEATPFRHLLMAGAARANKGLALVAGLAERMAARGEATTLLVQTTAKRTSGRRGVKEEALLQRLQMSGAPGLHTSDRALDSAGYGERFNGAMVLAPYDPKHFADNVSGVVLDALLRGAPVVASANSWPGRMVERFRAGAVFSPHTAEALDAAVHSVLDDWTNACERSRVAARVLAEEHDPAQLVRVLRQG